MITKNKNLKINLKNIVLVSIWTCEKTLKSTSKFSLKYEFISFVPYLNAFAHFENNLKVVSSSV